MFDKWRQYKQALRRTQNQQQAHNGVLLDPECLQCTSKTLIVTSEKNRNGTYFPNVPRIYKPSKKIQKPNNINKQKYKIKRIMLTKCYVAIGSLKALKLNYACSKMWRGSLIFLLLCSQIDSKLSL